MQIVVAGKLVFIERRKYFKSIYHFKIHMPVLVFALIILINSLLFVSHWESFLVLRYLYYLAVTCKHIHVASFYEKGQTSCTIVRTSSPKIIILDTCIRYANQSIIFKQLCPCVVDVEQQPISVPHECFNCTYEDFLFIKEWFEL